MEKVTFGDPSLGRGATSWRATVPILTRPEVKQQKILIGGVEHYEGKDGKQYRADLFDKYFLVKKGKINKKAKDHVSGRTEVILDQF